MNASLFNIVQVFAIDSSDAFRSETYNNIIIIIITPYFVENLLIGAQVRTHANSALTQFVDFWPAFCLFVSIP